VEPARPNVSVPCVVSVAPYLAVPGSLLRPPVSYSSGGVYVRESDVSAYAASPPPIS